MSVSPIHRRSHALWPFLLVAFMLLSLRYVAAQDVSGGMGFVYAYHFFGNDDSTTLVEFSYQFSNRGVTYRTEEGGSKVTARLHSRLVLHPLRSSDHDSLVTEWMNVLDAPAEGDELPRLVLGVQRLGIRPGSYDATLYLEDMNDPLRRGSADFRLVVPSFAPARLSMSSIQFADQLYAADEPENPFFKNGYVIIPNISGVIVGDIPQVVSYVEIYNADAREAPILEIYYQVAHGSTKRIFFERVDTLRPPFASAFILTDYLPLDSLPSGEYYLIVRAMSGGRDSRGDSAMSASPFALQNPPMDRLVKNMSTEETPVGEGEGFRTDPIFAGMTEAELDREWAKARYIARGFQVDVFDQLSGEEAKARFLSEFWSQRDDSPETPENEFRADYFARAVEAENFYRSTLAPNGWDSDRGRVLLQYGRPDGVDRHPQDFNRKPYEIWKYSSLGYEFVFVDRQQTGLYVLVHSTAPRETQFENWLDAYATLNRKWKNE